jgi:diguanylate cyclase (GGDEF)-like protein
VKNRFTWDAGLSQEELRGVSRTVAELEWLLLLLTVLYHFAFGPDPAPPPALLAGVGVFALFVVGFHYLNFHTREAYWKILLQTGVMIAFITWVVVLTGALASPLLSLYLLVVVTSALALGKLATVVQLAVIGGCYLALAGMNEAVHDPFRQGIASFAPLLLVAYVTAMLAADIRRAIGHVSLLSGTDELTGVLNMRAFRTLAERVYKQAARYSRPCSIMMIDSDSLKAVNDAHGHQTGNRLLKMIVHCVQEELRDTDVVARYGGDEFIVMLPETFAAGAAGVGTRIRQRVQESVLDTRDEMVKSSVSIGIASFPEHGDSLDSVIEKADRAMYASKESGKNRVTVWRPEYARAGSTA